jgi:hypothetical protein
MEKGLQRCFALVATRRKRIRTLAQVYVETHSVSSGRSKLEGGDWKSNLGRWGLEEQFCGH